mmetsp:Transcript_30786/g.95098  ORF Transcript_30786/g.95098 Transcript_30786/m.95098 type:complete len:216 (-) Transcript_30786:1113-1760(-)
MTAPKWLLICSISLPRTWLRQNCTCIELPDGWMSMPTQQPVVMSCVWHASMPTTSVVRFASSGTSLIRDSSFTGSTARRSRRRILMVSAMSFCRRSPEAPRTNSGITPRRKHSAWSQRAGRDSRSGVTKMAAQSGSTGRPFWHRTLSMYAAASCSPGTVVTNCVRNTFASVSAVLRRRSVSSFELRGWAMATSATVRRRGRFCCCCWRSDAAMDA